jgi:hypothetical protein
MNISTSTLAKRKLKSHIAKYGKDSNFVMTEQMLKTWFHVINKAAFRNKLPVPKFEIRNLRGAWGLAEAKGNCVISMSTAIDSRELMIGTLAHEMVHQWQYLFEATMSHTGSFLKWKRYFKKNLQISL